MLGPLRGRATALAGVAPAAEFAGVDQGEDIELGAPLADVDQGEHLELGAGTAAASSPMSTRASTSSSAPAADVDQGEDLELGAGHRRGRARRRRPGEESPRG
ncbi:MAG: hypothetical protein ABIY55_11290 [Kofleriaceae bacterium]